jgi:hypothetical protein
MDLHEYSLECPSPGIPMKSGVFAFAWETPSS